METIIVISQASILGPLLLSIFLNYLSLTSLRSIVCNFPYDKTLYCCGETSENVMEDLQSDLKVVLELFILGNFSICFLVKTWSYHSNLVLYLHGKHKPLKLDFGGFKLQSGKSGASRCLVKLLRLTIDHNLTFNSRVSNINYLQDG